MVVSEHGGLSAGLTKGKEFREQLVALLRTRSRVVVLGTVRAAALAQKTFEANAGEAGSDELLRSCLAEAMPELMACGGDRRLLVMTGDEQDAAALGQAVAQITGHAPSVVVDGSSDPVLCYEVAAAPAMGRGRFADRWSAALCDAGGTAAYALRRRMVAATVAGIEFAPSFL